MKNYKTFYRNEIDKLFEESKNGKHYLVELSCQNLDGITINSEYVFITNKKDFTKVVSDWLEEKAYRYKYDDNTVCEAYLYAKGKKYEDGAIAARRLFNKKFKWED